MENILKIKNLEEEFDLSELYLNNIWYYPIIKQSIIFPKLKSQDDNSNIKNRRVNYLDLIKSFINSLKWNSYNKTIQPFDFLFIDSAKSRRAQQDTLNYSVYSDYVIEYFPEMQSLIFEYPSESKEKHAKNIPSKNIYFPDFDLFKIFFKSRFKKQLDKINHIFLDKIFTYLGLEYDPQTIERLITKFFLQKTYFLKFLQKCKPQLVFLISSYNYSRMALICACNELNIPTVELQHGHIYKQHFGYIYKQVVDRKLLPDYFFSFGDYYSNVLKDNSQLFDKNSIFSIGNPFIEKMKEKSPDLAPELIQISQQKHVILVTSQLTIRKYLKKFVLELEDFLNDNFIIFYKPHHSEAESLEYYKEFTDKKIILIDNIHASTVELLKITHLHTTVYSTTLLEANYFMVPNVLFKVKNYSDFISDFIDNKTNFIANNAKEYYDLLNYITSNYEKIKEEIFYSTQKYYKLDASKNIRKMVNSIIK